MSINIEHMTQWVEALESGDYEQAEGQLVRIDPDDGSVSFCCLGVACELMGLPRSGESYFETREDKARYDENPLYFSDDKEFLGLPPANRFSTWLGIGDDRNDVIVSYVNDEGFLMSEQGGASMNDHGQSFIQIAAAIREEYLLDAPSSRVVPERVTP